MMLLPSRRTPVHVSQRRIQQALGEDTSLSMTSGVIANVLIIDADMSIGLRATAAASHDLQMSRQ